MPSVIAENTVVYMWLPVLAGAMTVEGVAKMGLFTYLDAIRIWNTSGKPKKKCWCFTDEGQVITGRMTQRIFEQASIGVRFVWSNQFQRGVDSPDTPNLSRAMWGNTRFKQAYGMLDLEEREDWIAVSGEELIYIDEPYSGTDGEGRRTSGTSRKAHIHPRLNHDIINQVTNTPGSSLLYLTRDAGELSTRAFRIRFNARISCLSGNTKSSRQLHGRMLLKSKSFREKRSAPSSIRNLLETFKYKRLKTTQE